ncbi:hypothetical protein GGI11_000244 [Coemansia sp. RSA 2049]|nr:hypothetical protein H4217_003156 [Coemansia sp. RSA 1939]KAJ2525210.1 hypothetical protein GGI11_000244 [Coemansia sp. RSA 2049]KAJ2607887.1 hypothetical protein EV177_005270 [Coemansia sp. RSA 1804]
MRLTLLAQAKAQYQWHKHVPLIRFIGPRKNVWKTQKQQQQQQQQSAVAGGSGSASASAKGAGEAINFWELPARYRPLPVSEAEIEAIESGGASTY